MRKYFYFILATLSFLACGNKTVVETDLVKSHTIHVEDISDTTNILTYLGDIPYSSDYDDEIIISDNRLLKFYDLPFKSLEITHSDGRIKRLSLKLFKESELADADIIKKILTEKIGEPTLSEYDNKILLWNSNPFMYELNVVEEGYSNSSKLLIQLNNDLYY